MKRSSRHDGTTTVLDHPHERADGSFIFRRGVQDEMGARQRAKTHRRRKGGGSMIENERPPRKEGRRKRRIRRRRKKEEEGGGEADRPIDFVPSIPYTTTTTTTTKTLFDNYIIFPPSSSCCCWVPSSFLFYFCSVEKRRKKETKRLGTKGNKLELNEVGRKFVQISAVFIPLPPPQ